MSATAARLKPALNVFISHAREDQSLVERLVRGLEPSAYKRVALTELEQPAFAESLLTELTQHSIQKSES